MNAITLHHLSKGFWLQSDKTFKELIPNILLGRPPGKWLTVLNDLSLEIRKGETVGIVGRNGAGKSTLLKLIAGVTAPEKGSVHVEGRVAPLIEVGAGFHHELSGYENIFLNGAILGMSEKEIKGKIDSIIAFSELQEFIHTPVKRYSSGMYMRLGFSVAIHTDAPILLIDEVLTVGDMSFQKKCLQYLQQRKERDKSTIVFVSHDDAAVRSFCERVVVLEGGKIIADASPEVALARYHAAVS